MDYEKWRNGSTAGQDYLEFQKEMKKDLNKQLKDKGLAIESFRKNHYEFSAVITKPNTNKFIYVSVSDVRGNQHLFEHTLIRTMEHSKDWSGGPNNYCSWELIGKTAAQMIEKEIVKEQESNNMTLEDVMEQSRKEREEIAKENQKTKENEKMDNEKTVGEQKDYKASDLQLKWGEKHPELGITQEQSYYEVKKIIANDFEKNPENFKEFTEFKKETQKERNAQYIIEKNKQKAEFLKSKPMSNVDKIMNEKYNLGLNEKETNHYDALQILKEKAKADPEFQKDWTTTKENFDKTRAEAMAKREEAKKEWAEKQQEKRKAEKKAATKEFLNTPEGKEWLAKKKEDNKEETKEETKEQEKPKQKFVSNIKRKENSEQEKGLER